MAQACLCSRKSTSLGGLCMETSFLVATHCHIAQVPWSHLAEQSRGSPLLPGLSRDSLCSPVGIGVRLCSPVGLRACLCSPVGLMARLCPQFVVLWDEAHSQYMFFQFRTTTPSEAEAIPAETCNIYKTQCYAVTIRHHHLCR